MTFLKKRLIGAVALSGLASLFSVTFAQASIITSLSITPDASLGFFDFTYSVTLSADERIVNGSYLTLYDFGPVAGSLPTATTGYMSTANFAYSQALKGPTPAFLGPTDSATVLNLTATYKGTLGTLSGATLGNGAVGNLGTFMIKSRSSTYVLANETSSAQNLAGQQDSNIGYEGVPAAVPLHGSLPVTATGIGLLALLGWRAKKKKLAALATV